MPKRTVQDALSPSAKIVNSNMKSVEKKKRARMGADSTPEGPVSRKRKTSTTRARTLKDLLNTMGNKKNEDKARSKKDKDDESLDVEPLEKSKPDKDDKSKSVLVAKKKSTTATDTKSGPSSRWGHSLCLINEGEAVMIGGQGGSGDRQVISKDSIWHLDIVEGTWDKPDTEIVSGQKPEARVGHTAVYDPEVRSIYVYGGSKNIKWFNDVHVLDLDTWKWELVKASGKAPTRAYHSTSLYRNELWTFGGVYPLPDPQPDGCSNDIHVYSPLEQSWYDPIVMGDKPSARSGHSATLLGDCLVVFGGWDAPICVNDLHVIDLVLGEWTCPVVAGKAPSKRSWHASTALSGNRVMIHGGYNGNNALVDAFIFNLDFMTWTEVSLDPPLSPRAGHTALCLPYKHDIGKHDQIVIFGGGDNEGKFFQDMVEVMLPWENSARDNSS